MITLVIIICANSFSTNKLRALARYKSFILLLNRIFTIFNAEKVHFVDAVMIGKVKAILSSQKRKWYVTEFLTSNNLTAKAEGDQTPNKVLFHFSSMRNWKIFCSNITRSYCSKSCGYIRPSLTTFETFSCVRRWSRHR